ncbi:MAG: DUF1840 family protein [Leucothrix sp.]
MLVVFTNKSGGTVEMFEKPALELINLMGRREAVPSAISAEDLPEALETLQKSLAEINASEKEEAAAKEAMDEEEDDDTPKAVGMSARAYPLTELIKQTIKDGSFLMWDYN